MLLRLNGFIALLICAACMEFTCTMVLNSCFPKSRRCCLPGCAIIIALPGLIWPFKWTVCVPVALTAAIICLGAQFKDRWHRKVLIICFAASFNIGAAFLGWWLQALVSPPPFQGTLPLRILLFVSSDMLLTAVGTVGLGYRDMTTLHRGVCALVSCWSMELLVCSLFLLKIQHDDTAHLPDAITGVCIFAAGYIVLTVLYAVYLRREITRERWQKAASTQIAEESEQFAVISSQLMATRQLRHDLNNHLMIIQVLAHEGQYEEAMRYLGLLKSRLQKPEP